MKPSKTSKAWMNEHVHDPFVQRAKAEGFRARAAYKLIEIDQRDRLFRPGMWVADLGAAPGSWCQVALAGVAPGGRVFALDLLPLAPLAGLEVVQGDFRERAVLEELERRLAGHALDLVISDMAPNLSGIASADQARAVDLCELALDFATAHLPRGAGRFLVKGFHGAGFDEFRRRLGEAFAGVVVRKPKASRDRSSEVYLLASGRR